MNSEPMAIQSHRGPYPVHFVSPFAGLEKGLEPHQHLIIDRKVASLYSEILKPSLASRPALEIEALEPNKSLEKIPEYITHLLKGGIKRGDELVAIGGGILQDISAFIAAVLFRGLRWRYYPTTLLAQADSCIGSKSSINVAGFKNQVGTFTPPQAIFIAPEVLETLTEPDFRSGVGEILKVHLLAGRSDFETIASDYPKLKKEKAVLLKSIRRSLEIKQELIEKDEFDQKERLLLNYGHSFGHALESATQYAVPHGIAVTIGIDMANFISWKFKFLEEKDLEAIHPVLKKNYAGFEKTEIPLERFFDSLSKDKKNVGSDLSLVLSRGPGKVFRDRYPFDQNLKSLCKEYFKKLKEGRWGEGDL